MKLRRVLAPTKEARKLKVLFLHTHVSPPLGADTWVHAELIRSLDRSSHEVFVACVRGSADDPTPTWRVLESVEQIHRIEVGPGPARPTNRSVASMLRLMAETGRWLRELTALAWLVHRRDIDILHTSDRPRDAVATVVIGRLTRTPSIIHAHVAFGDWMSGPLRWAIKVADTRFAVSDFVARGLVDAGCSAARTHVVHNAIDVSQWQRRDAVPVRADLGLPSNALVIVTVCRLIASKGVVELLEAFDRVRRHHPDVWLVVVGQDPSADGEYRSLLDDIVAVRGLEDRVIFAGHRPDVASVMADADIFAMPSHEEPFGLVYLEAMALELPVVALADGGTPEVVLDGVTGRLVRKGDAAALADALRELIDRADLRVEFGRAGRLRASSVFTVGAQAARVAELYRLVRSSTSTRER